MSAITFSAQTNAESIYFVHSGIVAAADDLAYCGRVARVGRRWVACPAGIGINGSHLAFRTRYEAALALVAHVLDNNNPKYIYPSV